MPTFWLLKNSLRIFLLEQLTEELIRRGIIEKKGLVEVIGTLKKYGIRAVKATKFNAPMVSFDPAKFLEVDSQNELGASWSDLKTLLTLSKKNCFVVLDDIDDYFIGIEHSARFIAALCRAVIDINAELKPTIFVLLLMKQGIWRQLFSNPEEYDKIKSVIEFLRWDLDHCSAVLAGRIASIHKMAYKKIGNFRDALPYLRKEIHGNDAQIRSVFELIFNYSNNGPRDVIDLCNSVRKRFSDRSITAEMVRACLPSYSEEKLNGLHADYGHIYPGVQMFLETV